MTDESISLGAGVNGRWSALAVRASMAQGVRLRTACAGGFEIDASWMLCFGCRWRSLADRDSMPQIIGDDGPGNGEFVCVANLDPLGNDGN